MNNNVTWYTYKIWILNRVQYYQNFPKLGHSSIGASIIHQLQGKQAHILAYVLRWSHYQFYLHWQCLLKRWLRYSKENGHLCISSLKLSAYNVYNTIGFYILFPRSYHWLMPLNSAVIFNWRSTLIFLCHTVYETYKKYKSNIT